MTSSTHTITAEIPIRVGSGQGDWDIAHIRGDVTFNYVPFAGNLPDIVVLKVVRLDDDFPLDEEFVTLKEHAEDWVTFDGGYDACCNLAEEKRTGDY